MTCCRDGVSCLEAARCWEGHAVGVGCAAGRGRTVGKGKREQPQAEAAPDASAVSASDEAHTVAQEPGSATPPVAEEDVARPQSNDAACTAVVTVRVMKAVDLVAKDRGGTSDPLVQLVLGSQTRETKIIPKTLNPEWDEVFRLNFTPNVGQTLDVVVYDHDKGLLSNSKEFLGFPRTSQEFLGIS